MNIIDPLHSGTLSTNEFTVYVALKATAHKNRVVTSAPQLATTLGCLSRHAVARSLRTLQTKNLLTWTPGRVSTIVLN